MRFFFRRSGADEKSASTNSAGLTTLELPSNDERAVEESPQPDEPPHSEKSPFLESPPRPASFAPAKKLVPASELPSASAALAELFADPPPAPAHPRQPSADVEDRSAKIEPAASEAAIHLKIADQDQPVEIIAEQARSSGASANKQPSSMPPAADRVAAALAGTQTRPVAANPQPESAPSLPQPATPKQEAAKPTDDSTELCPEDAATVLAAASEEIKAEEPVVPAENANATPKRGPVAGLHTSGSATPKDWEFEETLAAHREWIEAKGQRGKKADLANAELSGLELINVNLRLADLHYADLKGADLLLADLRDACMVRADLEEACLVGANLEGANLEGASLETALGIVSRQLAGANLREASLPVQIAQFPAIAVFRDASHTALRFFTAIMTLSALAALAIWKTKDIQLVTDSAILPFLHSARAAAAMPTAEIFLIAPVALFLLYLAFLQQIQKVCGAALELPAVFPDGTSLGEKESGIVLGLLRAHFRWMNQETVSSRTLETTISLLLAYWTVPFMLFLFWARYLTLQEIHGTMLHEILASVAAGIAVHATFKVGRPRETWAVQRTLATRVSEKLRRSKPPVLVGILFAIATFISFGTIWGVPHNVSRAPQYGPANIRRWAPTALWAIGYDPYADLTEAQFSTPPAHWNWSDDTVGSVRGLRLNDPHFRYAQAYGAFLANARLWHADFRGAYLSNADFRAADLTQSSFQSALMDSARMNHANLDRSNFQSAHLARTDFRDANMSYAILTGTFTMDARFDGASLYDGLLSSSTLIRATFERSDLRNSHIDAANLEHADLRSAYLWSASVQNSDLKDADLGGAILIGASLRGSNLSGAHFAQTILTETDMTGAILDGADFRGAFSLTAYQVCTARSHTGALFDAVLQPQIDARCPIR
ncbi:MAG TPA: pentapeptide repeat-containing protein [Candidatus Acidoferrales bacterium]|nr:pentapeptide repeat-containing protein [Candidatus Acidoferrales bacterium]